MINFDKLKLLLDVVDAGAISKAAVYRGVPQSYVSRQIAELERQYGGHLFSRNGRGVQLTELGAEVVPQIRELIDVAARVESTLRQEARIPRGEVRIGILTTFIGAVAAPLWTAMRQQLPEVQLQIQEGTGGQLEERLASGRLDIALVLRNQGSQAMDTIMPGGIVFHVVGARGSKPLAAPTIAFAQLARLPLVLPGSTNGMRAALDQAARKEGLRFDIVLETDSFLTQLHLAATGRAFAVLGPYAARAGIVAGELQSSKLVEPEIARDIGLAFTTSRPASFAAREAARILRKTVLDALAQSA